MLMKLAVRVFYDCLYSLVQNSVISIFLFRFSTLKTCFNLDKFWPRLTMCELWYMIQYTSTFRIAFILYIIVFTRFPRNFFRKILKLRNFLFQFFRLWKPIWTWKNCLSSPHIVWALIHDSTYFHFWYFHGWHWYLLCITMNLLFAFWRGWKLNWL